MINLSKQKQEQNESIHTLKPRERYVEDYMAQNYHYIYNRTYFAKTLYSNFAKEIKNKRRKYLKDQQQEKVKEKRGTKKVLEIGCATAILANLLFTDKQINHTDNKVEVYCMYYYFNMLEIEDQIPLFCGIRYGIITISRIYF